LREKDELLESDEQWIWLFIQPLPSLDNSHKSSHDDMQIAYSFTEGTMNWKRQKDSEVERLTKLLEKNCDKVTIKSDGFLRLNLSNRDVREKISATAESFSRIKITE
jgi:hypothetical protein